MDYIIFRTYLKSWTNLEKFISETIVVNLRAQLSNVYKLRNRSAGWTADCSRPEEHKVSLLAAAPAIRRTAQLDHMPDSQGQTGMWLLLHVIAPECPSSLSLYLALD
jgi:hypothetical protein